MREEKKKSRDRKKKIISNALYEIEKETLISFFVVQGVKIYRFFSSPFVTHLRKLREKLLHISWKVTHAKKRHKEKLFYDRQFTP